MTVLWRILLLAVAALLIWRIASSGMSSYYIERLSEGDASAAPKALAWNSREPHATFHEALASLPENPETATAFLQRAYAENPAETKPLLVTAGIVRSQGDQARADALVTQAADLLPANPGIQQEAAAYWVSRGHLEQAMQHWSRALEADPAVGEQLFPLLLKIAEDTRTRGVFKALAYSPPPWWDRFFAEVARRALNVETVRLLYALRRDATDAPFTEKERQAYVKRLQKDGVTTEAYLVWVNGLSETERAHLGLLYNGGFELGPSNRGFDWHLGNTEHVAANTATTYGIDGNKALHLTFKRREKRYHHLFQPLFLDPGTYRVTGKVRTESLETKGGLKWQAQCRLPTSQTLGESERFLGSGEWREFSFEFQVPESCTAQEIRLHSTGKRAFEHKITGAVWFDGMSIRKILGAIADSDA
ncbi:MAG: hypothetical protein U9Q81_11990 [Pseudomonadota bacterium]|nr:hypothetical protein [Pseudomonadota bacterium]